MRRLPIFALALVALLVAWTPGALDKSVPQYGRVAFGTVSHNSAATADAVITLTGRRRIVVCTNSLNSETILTYNAANWVYLPASTSVAVDLSASGLTFDDGKVIGIYYLSAQPTSGSVGCTAH